MQRGLLIFLAVALSSWLSPTAQAITRAPATHPASYDIAVAKSFVVVGDGITMDTYAGNNEDPLSLHKYLYCHDNPVTGLDPSGHDLESLIFDMSIRVSMAAQTLAPVINAGRYAATAIFLAGVTFDQQFRDNAVAMGPDIFSATAGEVTCIISELRGMYLSQRVVQIAAPQVAKLGDSILKDVDDEMLVHFFPAKDVKSISQKGLQYVDGGVGTHFFKAGEVKKLIPQQVKAAIGDLAGSSQDISGAAIVDPKKLSNLQQFQKAFWTEFLTTDKSVMPEMIRGISAQ